MRISVVSEQVFAKTPDGAYWTTGASESFWKRYLDVFDQLRIVARVENTPSPPSGSQPIDHSQFELVDLPFYRGPGQLLRLLPRVRATLRYSYDPSDAWLLRIPSTLANLLMPVLEKNRQSYAVEVVGDPQDVFARGGIAHLLRPVFRRWFSQHQIKQCQNAVAAAYVTKSRLQDRYTASPAAMTTHYSSLDLPDNAYVGQARPLKTLEREPLRLITVASLSQLYKAPHILIDAFARCLGRGCNLRLEIVGDGKFRSQLERQVANLGIQQQVQFTGQIPGGAAIWQRLDDSDLFVLPSMTEGLPRAMIEAMARGLPCIGSTAGGMPELLPRDFLVRPGCRESLAGKIAEVCSNPSLMHTMSTVNLHQAQQYRSDILRARRNALYRKLLEITQNQVGRVAA